MQYCTSHSCVSLGTQVWGAASGQTSRFGPTSRSPCLGALIIRSTSPPARAQQRRPAARSPTTRPELAFNWAPCGRPKSEKEKPNPNPVALLQPRPAGKSLPRLRGKCPRIEVAINNGPSLRTQHLGLDAAAAVEPPSDQVVSISGTHTRVADMRANLFDAPKGIATPDPRAGLGYSKQTLWWDAAAGNRVPRDIELSGPKGRTFCESPARCLQWLQGRLVR